MRMKKEWQEVIIPNAEWEMKDVVKAFRPLGVRIEIEGPYPDEDGNGAAGIPTVGTDGEPYTDTVYIFIGDTTVVDLFSTPGVGKIVASADEVEIGTWNPTGEKILALWWD
jgi:hypothetical protein